MSSAVTMQKASMVTCFCLSIFLGAFLLFAIEPLVGKIVTAQYGGTASVWTICLLFFQLVVLVGYSLACLISRLSPKAQIGSYAGLLLFSLFWSKILSTGWQSGTDTSHPIEGLLIALTVRIAVPCAVLATTSGIMQLCFAMARLGNPYPLYSLSNAGSFTALLAYPILIEPVWTLSSTLEFWSYGYWIMVAIALVCAAIAWARSSGQPHPAEKEPEELSISGDRIRTKDFLRWVGFSCLGSCVLLSYSSYITSEVSPTPLLWVLPLALYLLAFSLVFASQRFYRKKFFLGSWLWMAAIEPVFTLPASPMHSFILGLFVNLVLVFELCVICHGELASSKPSARHLTSFYLAVSLGGALGGVFIGVLAPLAFSFDAERPIVIVILGILTLYELILKKRLLSPESRMLALAALPLLALLVWALISIGPRGLIYRERNFYSSARIVEEGGSRAFYHGRIFHGAEFLDPAKKDLPVSPYAPNYKLISDFLHSDRGGKGLSIGIIGLGVGEFAAYGNPADTVTYYELDPKVKRIAERFFTYLADSKAKVDVLVGDGRALVAARPSQNYDLLVVDAFNGDAIPSHLLTREALLVYLKQLVPDGILAFHITNKYVDLQPVLAAVAQEQNMFCYTIRYQDAFRFVVMSRSQRTVAGLLAFFKDHAAHDYPRMVVEQTAARPGMRVWSDDYSNLVTVLNLH